MTLKQYKNDIIAKMKALNIYKPQFEHAILGLARLLVDQQETLALFEKSGGQIMIKHTNKAGATNAVKNPFYLALETLRQDILQYMRELGLTPASLKRINRNNASQGRVSPLADALKNMGKSVDEPPLQKL